MSKYTTEKKIISCKIDIKTLADIENYITDRLKKKISGSFPNNVEMQNGENHFFENAVTNNTNSKLRIFEIDKKTELQTRCIAEFNNYDVKNWYEKEGQG